jgi:hypothetical protein
MKSFEEIKVLLLSVEKKTYNGIIVQSIPHLPKENEEFIYVCRSKKDCNYLLDGYIFINKGNNRKTSEAGVLREYYSISNNGKEFHKRINRLKCGINPDTPALYIVYNGDSTAFTPRPHGNSIKRKAFYARTSKDDYAEIRNNFEYRKKPKDTYIAILPHTAVKNLKQVRNVYSINSHLLEFSHCFRQWL